VRCCHAKTQDVATPERVGFSPWCSGSQEERVPSADARRVPALMPCYTPLKAYRAPGGGIAFDSKRGYQDRPLNLPCGQCIGCRWERSRQWALRCVHESQLHRKNAFITLTYDQEHLPEDLGLDVRDWQKFAKRLRKRKGRFRFFHCGEYGSENLRPHYHALLFGMDFDDRYPVEKKNGKTIYSSNELESVWGLGNVTVGDVSYESAAYVARYVIKKVTGDLAEEHYRRIDGETGEVWKVRPEYTTMSRRPGIGARWLEKFKGDVFPSDEVVHGGRKFRPPRFYDSKLPDAELSELKRKRRRAVGVHADDLTPERLSVREKVAAARLSGMERRL